MNKPSAPLPAYRSKSRDQLKVLVVDDDPFQLEFVSDILRSLGLSQITAATSGDKALQALSAAKTTQAPFDLMLSDLHMPGMDGFQFMAAVAAGGFAGALIIFSGQSSEVMHSATLVAQLRRFTLLGTLTKPVEKAQLSALLSKLLA
jgi:CheY-like chemotaxis protein